MKLNRKQFEFIRKKLRWSFSSIAKELNINRKTVSNWEKGVTEPSDKRILELANIFGVSVDKISDAEKKKSTEVDIEKATKSWMSLFKEKEDAKKDVHYISQILDSLHNKLNNASVVMYGILNSLNFPTYIKNKENRYIMVNKEFLLNVSYHDIDEINFFSKPKNDYNFFSKKEAKENLIEDWDVIINNKPVIDKERNIPGTRKKKWGIINKIPIIDNNSEVAGLIGIFVDITDRKKEEHKREILEKIINHIHLFVWMENTETEEFVFVNDFFAKFFKLNKFDIYSKSKKWLETLNTSFLKRRYNFYEKIKKKPTQQIIISEENKEENGRTFRETIFSLEKKYLLGTCLDITEKQELEKIKNNLIELNDISEEIVALVEFDESFTKRKTVYVNNAIEKMTGLKKEQYTQGDFVWRSLIYEDDKDKFFDWYNNLTLSPKELAYRIVHAKNKNIIWVNHKKYKIGNVVYSNIKDVTEYKKLEIKNNTQIKYCNMLLNHLDDNIRGFFIIEINPNLKVIYVSDNCPELFNISKEYLYRYKFWSKILKPINPKEIIKDIKQNIQKYESNTERSEFSVNRKVRENLICNYKATVQENNKYIITGFFKKGSIK